MKALLVYVGIFAPVYRATFDLQQHVTFSFFETKPRMPLYILIGLLVRVQNCSFVRALSRATASGVWSFNMLATEDACGPPPSSTVRLRNGEASGNNVRAMRGPIRGSHDELAFVI
jgi:hypothetical protein